MAEGPFFEQCVLRISDPASKRRLRSMRRKRASEMWRWRSDVLVDGDLPRFVKPTKDKKIPDSRIGQKLQVRSMLEKRARARHRGNE